MNKKINRIRNVVDERNEAILPTYTPHKRKNKIHIRIKWVIITAAILALVSLIYVAPLFISETGTVYSSKTVTPDPQALGTATTYMKNNPDADFDEDGLTNEQELSAGTGVWIADNDGDGVSDYAELFIVESNPTIQDDQIIEYSVTKDTTDGATVNTPFKMNGVVLWADDYESKARGGVIKLEPGHYRFSNFNGWVQCPEGAFVYIQEYGRERLLSQNANGYSKIESKGKRINVRVYSVQQEKMYKIKLFGNYYYLPDNFGTGLLNFILPSYGNGIVYSKETTINDKNGVYAESYSQNPILPVTEIMADASRFGRNQVFLTDLGSIINELKAGNNVLISLMSHKNGEKIVMIYGYSTRYHLLICDPVTGEELGVLTINPYAKRMLDKKGIINTYEMFDFNGCGFSSKARNRLSILYSVPSVKVDEPIITPEPEPIPTPEPINIEDVLMPSFGTEDSFYQHDGLFQRTLKDVTADDFQNYLTEAAQNFILTEAYTNEKETVLYNEKGDIVIFRYSESKQTLVIRLELAGSKQTVQIEQPNNN